MSGQSGVAGLTDYNKWDKIASEIPDDPKPAQKGAHPEQNADGFVKGQDNIPDKKMLKEQLDNMDEELKLSDKEKKRLAECFEKKEFRDMFNEYIEEISDPVNRKETDDYLRQCESGLHSGQVPEGLQLVLPKPGFCIKTKTLASGAKVDATGKELMPGGTKVFINVTHSEKVKEAKSIRVPGQGENWEIPYSLDNPKEEKDSKGNPCVVHTICFNTHCYEPFSRDKRRKEFLIDVALENVELNRGCKLDRSWSVMTKWKYKGPDAKPSVLSIRKEDQNPNASFGSGDGPSPGKDALKEMARMEAKKARDERDAADAAAGITPGEGVPGLGGKKARKEAKRKLKEARSKAEKEGTIESGFFGKPGDARNAGGGGLIEELDAPPPVVEVGMVEPQYKVLHRGHFEMSDNMEGRHGAEGVESLRPRELVFKIELPRVGKAREVDLDVSAERLVLEVEGKYKLEVALPFPIDDENGKAKFDKDLRQMVVTLPVCAAPVVEIARAVPEPLPETESEEEEEVPITIVKRLGGKGGGGKGVHDRSLKEGEQPPPRLPQAAAAPSPAPAPAAVAQPKVVVDPAVDFEAHVAFEGRQPGFVFKAGPKGVGYYRDGAVASSAGDAEGLAAAPAIVPMSQEAAARAVRSNHAAVGIAPPGEAAAAKAKAKAAEANAKLAAARGIDGFENTIMLELD